MTTFAGRMSLTACAVLLSILVSAPSFADENDGAAWVRSFHEALPAGSVASSNLVWHVNVDGNTHFEVRAGHVGQVTFTNLVMDVDRYPVFQLDVPRVSGQWSVLLGPSGSWMSNVYTSVKAGQISLDLPKAFGWSGIKTADCRIVFEDTSSGDGQAVRFDLASAANKDVIYENQVYSGATNFGGNPAATTCFVEDRWNDGSVTVTGLPPDRIVASADASLGSYRLLPYSSKNVIEMDTSTDAAEQQYTIDIPNRRYSKVGMLVSGAEGDAMLSLRYNYLDGTAVTNFWWADDWYVGGSETLHGTAVVSNMNRVVAATGAAQGDPHFNLFEFIGSAPDTNRVLDSVTVGTRPYHDPVGSHVYAGVFALNGRATSTNQSFIELREMKLSVKPGWEIVDAFNTHHWVGRFTNTSYGPFVPFDKNYNGWRHAFEAEFSRAHPVEGVGGLRVKMPITPAAQFNWMHFETSLPEPEDWRPYKIFTFDPYMEGSPLGLPLMGLIVWNPTGGCSRVPLILGWQLFQWENRQMTWPLQGNVAAGEVNGVQQWQIPPIPFEYLSNVVKVSCGFEYYFDPEMSETYVHMDNLRLGSTQMWDNFDGPDLGWFNGDPAVRCGIGGNRTLDASAGSLVLIWPSATNYVFVRTGASHWEQNWHAFGRIKVNVWAAQTNTKLRIILNGSVTTTVATVVQKEKWVPLVWDLPAGVTAVSSLEIGVVDALAAGKVYLDDLSVGGHASRIESLHAWALKDVNQLTWHLSATDGVQSLRVCWQTNGLPASATNGAPYQDLALGSSLDYTWNHGGVANEQVYGYAVFLRDGSGVYSPVAADSVARVSRRILLAGGAADTFEAGFSKENGALLYVHDRATGRTISHGTEAENLWRIIFVGEEIPDLHAAWFSPDDPGLRFSYSESPLVLNYRYESGNESLGLSIAVDAWQTNKLRLRASMTNLTAHAVRTVELPRKLSFAITNINRVVFPIQEGMAFRRDFFEHKRYSIQPRPWLFADFIGLDSSDGFMSLYAIQDSFFGSDILPRHDPAKPIFQPANIGVGASMDIPGKAFMDYEMVTYVPTGGVWNGPTMVIHVDSDSVRSSIASYRNLNGFNDTNRYPTLKMKLDSFGLFEKLGGAPFMAIECDKVVNWLKAPYGDLWNTVRNEWLDILPRDNILHFTHWQEGILEDWHPDCQPILWEKYGEYDELTNMIHAARSDGWLVMPFLNWTVWNKSDVVRRDSRGSLLPISAGALKVNGTPFYEYLGYMVKPWNDNVYNVHSNMMMFYKTNQPMDLTFVDMTCERTWRYTRIDADDDGEDETIFTGYTQATIDHNNYLKQFFPLYTEGVMDSMMGEVSGYCQTHRQKMMMDILSHVGSEFGDWSVFPLAADIAHDHVGFYQHDLNLQVFPRTKPLITHYTTMGYCYIVDVATWYGEVDTNGLNWMYICDDFQKAVVSKYFGLPLNLYNGAVGGDERVIMTSYGVGTNEVTILGNYHESGTIETNDCLIASQGFMATMPSNRLVAGIFNGTFNGAALTPGDHFIAVERISNAVISVKHPGGSNTVIAIDKPDTWAGDVMAIYVLRDGTELYAPGHVTVVGDQLLLNYTAKTHGGSPVAGYKMIDLDLYGNTPPRFLQKPYCETVGATQLLVHAQANKPVSIIVRYGRTTPNEYVVTNTTFLLSHALLVNLPEAGGDWWFNVTIIDETGESFTSGRMFYPAQGLKQDDQLDTVFLADHGVVRLDLSGIAEKDIVYNAGDASNDVFGEKPGATYCFVENGWTDGVHTAKGLPSSRLIPSTDPGLGRYVLLPYSDPNVIEMVTTGRTETYFIPLAKPGKFDRIGILGAACEGWASFRIQLHYQGDSGSYASDAMGWGVDDWISHTRPGEVIVVVSNMDRAAASSGTVDPVGGVKLYEYILTSVDPKAVLTGITITEAPYSWPSDEAHYGAVFAVNLRQAMPHSMRLNLSSVANKDLVVNASDVSNDGFGPVSGGEHCFVEDGFSGADGLPSSRLIPSRDSRLGEYELLPYDGPNAIMLVSTGKTAAYYIPMPGTGRVDRIGILGAACPTQASFRIQLHYQDAFGDFSVTDGWWGVDGWLNPVRANESVYVTISNMDRAVASTRAIDDINGVNLYEYIFTGVDPRRYLKGITITEAPFSWSANDPTYAAVLAVNCRAVTNIQSSILDLNGWRDWASDPSFVCTVTSDQGRAVITLPAAPQGGQISGRVLSPVYDLDLDRYPIVELRITGAGYQGFGYQIGIQEERDAPWPLTNIFAGTRSGTLILNIPKLTGWAGPRRFSVSIAMSSINTNRLSMSVDYIRVRSDSDVAWSENFDPMRDNWGDLVANNAELTDLGNGTARLHQIGGEGWGELQSETVVMDVRDYPYMRASVTEVDAAANVKIGAKYVDLGPLSVAVSGPDAPYTRSGPIDVFSRNALDVMAAALVIEGTDRNATLDMVQFERRPLDGCTVAWDTTRFNYQVGEGGVLWLGGTAADSEGGPVGYESYGLPGGAVYDGFLVWTTQLGQAGTHYMTLFASNETGQITNRLMVTVTNGTVQLIAPEWDDVLVVATSVSASVSGYSWEISTNIDVEVSAGGAPFSTNSVVMTSADTFSWTGRVTAPLVLQARVHDRVRNVYSSSNECHVYPGGGPAMAAPLRLEKENATSVWVLIRADTQVTARVVYGRMDVNEFAVQRTNFSLTHAVLCPVNTQWPYWFQVLVTDAQGRSALSEKLPYAPNGIVWSDTFSTDASVGRWKCGDWATFSVAGGNGVVHLPANPPGHTNWGKIESERIDVNVDQFPILEIDVPYVAPSNVGFAVTVRELVGYTGYTLFADSRAGPMLLNIPELTGWHGRTNFLVEFFVSSIDENPQDTLVDRVILRTDANLAWEDTFDTLSPLWTDEDENTNFNALILHNPPGQVRVTQVFDGSNSWGQAQSAMTTMNLAWYPWFVADVQSIDDSANFIAGIQHQLPPYDFNVLVSGADTPFVTSGEMHKAKTNFLDRVRFSLIVEGTNKSALVNGIRVTRRAPDIDRPYWDTLEERLIKPEGAFLRAFLTATDYKALPVEYYSEHLPQGASYNGILQWDTTGAEPGSYRPTLIARSGESAIAKRVQVTVTDANYQLHAPLWNELRNVATGDQIAASGTYDPATTNVVVEVSVDGGDFSVSGVFLTNNLFTWTGDVVASPMILRAKVTDPDSGFYSSISTCEVYSTRLGPEYLRDPVIEFINETSVWVLVRAETQIVAEVHYGRGDADERLVQSEARYSMTHAIRLQPLEAGWAYWFQVIIRDRDGRAGVSRKLHYPINGIAWREEFDRPLKGWRDATRRPEFAATLTTNAGHGLVTLPPGQTYGKVLSSLMILDVDQFPILEVAVPVADFPDAHYEIGIQQEARPWNYYPLMMDTRSGNHILNIPDLTGWHGTQTFSLAFSVGTVNPAGRTIEVDHFRVRTERNLAWQESCNPLRTSWVDEADDPLMNAYLVDQANGTARLSTAAGESYGKAMSEMLFMDLSRYAWLTLDGPGVSVGGELRFMLLNQRGSGEQTNLIISDATPFSYDAPLDKFDTNVVDISRIALYIVGAGEWADISELQISKRPRHSTHMLFWDFPAREWRISTNEVVIQPFTATDFEGADIEYEAVDLPAGATYDGAFRWTPEFGQYDVTFIARSAYFALTNVMSIVVTGAYKVCLGYDNETGVDTFPQAVAEQSNYSGAASIWMSSRYIHPGFDQTQAAIRSDTLANPGHNDETTPASCAEYLRGVEPPAYAFTNRVGTNLNHLLKEALHWLDYDGGVGQRSPVCVLSGTNWAYKVVRGLYADSSFYGSTRRRPILKGLWLSEPKAAGLGHTVFATPYGAEKIFRPSDAAGDYYLCAQAPFGLAMEQAESNMALKFMEFALPITNSSLATCLSQFIVGENLNTAVYDLVRSSVPEALQTDLGFAAAFEAGGKMTGQVVLDLATGTKYVLLAGGRYGRASTRFVCMANPSNGSLDQVTWIEGGERYPRVDQDAAVWLARHEPALSEAPLVTATLVYGPELCVSHFLPSWRLSFLTGTETTTVYVAQNGVLSGDADGDGMSDGDELYAGTDPDDVDSVFELGAYRGRAEGEGGTPFVIEWPSATNRTYGIDHGTNILRTLTREIVDIPATPPLNSYTSRPPGALHFYRVIVE